MGKRVADIPDGAPFFDLTHLDNPARPANVLLIVVLLAAGATTYMLHEAFFGDGFSETALATYCWVYLVISVLLALFKLARPGPRNWLSPDVVFWLIFTMFHVPYIVFYLWEWTAWSNTVFHSADATNRGMCVVVMSLVGFMLGYELGPTGRVQPAVFQPVRRIPRPVFSAAQGLLFTTLIVSTLALILGAGSLILTEGYGAMRKVERFGVSAWTDRIIGLTRMASVVAMMIYIVACAMRHRRVVQGVLLPALMVANILFFLVVGHRSGAAILTMPLIYGYHYFVRRIPAWFGVSMLASAIVLFGVIGIGRKAGSISPSVMIRAYQDYRQDVGVSPWVASLAEAGASFKTVNVACTYIPSQEPYWMGRSVLDSLMMVIPSPVVGMRQHIAPATWATFRATGEAGLEVTGWGSSIAMEGYMNFGIIGGAIFVAAVGFMMRRIYDGFLRRPTFLRMYLMLISIGCLSMWIRNYSHHFIRPVVWQMILVWVFWLLCGGYGRSQTRSTSGQALRVSRVG